MAFFGKKEKNIDYESEYEKVIRKIEMEKVFNFDEPILLKPNDHRIYYLGEYILKNYVTVHKSNGRGRETDDYITLNPFWITVLIGRSRIEIGSCGNLLEPEVYMCFHDERLPVRFSFDKMMYRLKDGSSTEDVFKVEQKDVEHGYYEAFFERTNVDTNRQIVAGIKFDYGETTVPERFVATHVDHHGHSWNGVPINSTVGQYERLKEQKKKIVNEWKFPGHFEKALKQMHQAAESKISYNNNRYKKQMEYYKENGLPDDHVSFYKEDRW